MDKIAVVTGGGGFLGRALCLQLIASGFCVRAIQRGEYPELAARGIVCFREDLAKPSNAFASIFDGVHVVFHVAAKVDMWGPYEDFYRVNVTGTQNVLNAAQSAGVPFFVYTSSPSVIASGVDLRGVDETVPYPQSYSANYPKTKSIAERAVLDASGDGICTCALRPHLIWGPGDTNLIPTVLERAKAGRLVQVGAGENKVDLTYIDDCVAAHLCALTALEQKPDQAGGKSYFISQGDPVGLWQWINEILERHNMPPVKRKIPVRLAHTLAALFELVARLRPGTEPLFTRFLVEEMATDHYFDISRARELLGFIPRYSVAEALERAFPRSS